MRYTVLVAEDDPVTRLLLRDALKAADCEVTAVENGRLAVERAAQQDFDLVLIDLLMPEMSGVEAIRIISMSEPDLPIMAVTGAADNETRAEAMQNGATVIMQKPFLIRELLRTVSLLLGCEAGLAVQRK